MFHGKKFRRRGTSREPGSRAEAPPVQEGIAGGDVDFEIVGIAQPGDARHAQGGEEQAEATTFGFRSTPKT